MESRTQRSRPRSRTQKKNPWPRTDLSRTDPLEAKDRNGRGQSQGQGTQFFLKYGWQIFHDFKRKNV